jgi:hypothetical protein
LSGNSYRCVSHDLDGAITEMFCPLCKSEYRQGVTACQDCSTPLVATYEEAESFSTRILWEGTNERVSNEVLAALGDARIPCTSELRAGPDQIGSVLLAVLLRAIFWRFGLFKKYAARQRGWRIKVLQSNYSQAKEIIGDPDRSRDSDSN